MRCLHPRTVGFQSDGKTIAWSQKSFSREYSTFQLPCSKCIECRLEYARSWAIRCVHEAKMHQDNSFITLTYSDEFLKSNKLQYIDFQLFIKRLRKYIWKLNSHKPKEDYAISIFATGEYGEIRKRPHWHALIFNFRPFDCKYKYTNDNGDRVFSSETLDKLWGYGITEIGSITFQSAGYVARYAAKKLVHGDDGHEYEPISKKSSKHAIGKKFLEKYWKDIFNYGYVILEGGQKTTIPRYYEKWLAKNHPEAWEEYIIKVKKEKIATAQAKADLEKQLTHEINENRLEKGKFTYQTSKQEMQKIIIKQKFQNLQKHLKGDI